MSRENGLDNGRGDVWTWTALEADSKLIISWAVGDRDAPTADYFIRDVSNRLANRVQLITDGHRPYLKAVENHFGMDIDYAMLVKLYGEDVSAKRGSPERRYSPGQVIGTRYQRIKGAPNEYYTSTSFAERHNLTMRMQMRRFTRLTNTFSKKFDNRCHALAIYFVWYNFTKIHKAHKLTQRWLQGSRTSCDRSRILSRWSRPASRSPASADRTRSDRQHEGGLMMANQAQGGAGPMYEPSWWRLACSLLYCSTRRRVIPSKPVFICLLALQLCAHSHID
jgi:IS1 family transposase